TGEAVRQARQAIRRARRDNPHARIIFTGCAAQTEKQRLVDRADLQFDAAGVVEFLRQRDPVPIEHRTAHIEGDRRGPVLDGVGDAGDH
ncbi:hypothetical protein ACC687_39220, partial [Rhizobium ruizarguesonis]